MEKYENEENSKWMSSNYAISTVSAIMREAQKVINFSSALNLLLAIVPFTNSILSLLPS